MELMAGDNESWDTARRRNRHGGENVSGVGAREANSIAGSTPGPSKGSAGPVGRQPVVSSPPIDRTQLVYQSVAIELNGQNVTRSEVIDALIGLVEGRDILTLTRLAREWQVTFARKEPMEVIGGGGGGGGGGGSQVDLTI